LLAAGSLVALLMLLRRAPSDDNGLGESFRYDLSALRSVDPALMIGREVSGFDVDVREPTAMVLGPSNTVYVGGAGEIVQYSHEGRRLSGVKVPGLVTALALGGDGGLMYCAMRDNVAVLARDGVVAGRLGGLNSNSVCTAIALAGNSVFVADAGNRVVLRYGNDGAVVSRFGGKESEYSEGFVIPSPYFPLVTAADETLWVVDPGRHRFINFTQDGRIRSRWEKSSMTIEGFCGCCNPTHFALREDGSFVTAEKGLVRVKIHGPDGNLAGVVAAPDSFGRDTRGLALAVDANGRILVLDPERSRVRVFAVNGREAGHEKGSAK
jgi:hypothetical protein